MAYSPNTIVTDPTTGAQQKVDSSGSAQIAGEGTAGAQAGGVVTVQGDPAGTPAPTAPVGNVMNSYSPDPSSVPAGTGQFEFDDSNRLETHSTVTSDEGSFRDDFTGTSLTTTLTGTLNFTNNSTAVVGVGTTFTSQVRQYQYIKKTSDGETLYAEVASVNSNTSITLAAPYTGTTATGQSSVVSKWVTSTGTGASVTVANSIASLVSGTTAAQGMVLFAAGDYLPYTIQFYASISQRIANQVIELGLVDNPFSVGKQCLVQFTGTTNTTGAFVTAFSSQATEIQSTAFTLPNGGNTSTYHLYKIDLSNNQATLSVDGVVVAVNTLHIPGPYDNLDVFFGLENTATAASNTTLNVDYAYFYNCDRLQIDDDFAGEPLGIQGAVPGGQTDYGNPVKVGGIYLSTLPTYVTGQRTDLQADINGRIIISPTITLPVSGTLGATQSGSWTVGATQSGTWTNTVTQATASNLNAQVVGNVASLSTDSGNPLKTGGVYNSTLPTATSGQRIDLQVDARGRNIPSPNSGIATYSATFVGAVTATTATDVFTIFGSATKKCTITKFGFSCTQTTASSETFLLTKKTAVNATGTSAAVTAMPHDSTQSAATATLLSYTANPGTLGAATTIRAIKQYIGTTTTALNPLLTEMIFNENGAKGIVLNSASEGFALNLNSQTMAGNAFAIYIEWTEE